MVMFWSPHVAPLPAPVPSGSPGEGLPEFVTLFAFGALAIFLGVMVIRQAGRRRRQAQRMHEVAGAMVTLFQIPAYFGGGVAILVGSLMSVTAVFMAF